MDIDGKKVTYFAAMMGRKSFPGFPSENERNFPLILELTFYSSGNMSKAGSGYFVTGNSINCALQ